MMTLETATRFKRLGIITIAAIYFLILVGGIVRASGAGMGCPDWPTCFGQWVPPTDESQLPPNYHEIYAQRGYKDTQFNPVKTWTEYLNRLTGVSIGILIFLTAYASRVYRQTDKTVFYLAVAAFFLVGFQGWLGSAVVASHLKPVVITLHMLLAFIIVIMLVYAIVRSQRDFIQPVDVGLLPDKFKTVLSVAIGMTLLQILMGTQIRETVDFMANETSLERRIWRESFPIIFYVHRSFSSVILFTNAWLVWKLWQTLKEQSLFLCKLGAGLMVLIVTAILAGISLDRLGMPVVAQPVHLLMANLIFGAQFFLYFFLAYAKRNRIVSANTRLA